MIRDDHEIAKMLYVRKGLPAAMEWQRLPFVDVTAHIVAERDPQYTRGGFDRLMFDDAVYCSLVGDARVKYFIYRVEATRGDRLVRITLFVSTATGVRAGAWLVDNAKEHPPTAEENPFDGTTRTLEAQEIHSVRNFLSWIVSDMRWLARSDCHPVETSPAVATRRQKKTARHKPWARTDLPRIIMLDLASARAHGFSGYKGGTHASPIPHQRRGHWHVLRHAKYKRNDDGTPRRIWVRPAWVGDREWHHKGNTYRVLDTREADHATS